jgi:aspartyl/asparaginyl beta-hydroxylase (cupin superfamily)
MTELDPADLARRGLALLLQRQFATAADCLRQCVALAPERTPAWLHLAMAERGLGRREAEWAALQGALEANPFDPMGLLMKAGWLERAGEKAAAAKVYQAALTVVAQTPEVATVEMQPLLERARRFTAAHQQAYADFMDRAMADAAAALPPDELRRFWHTLDIHLGRRQRFDAQPMGLFYAQLAPVEFFDRRRFAWVDALEARTDAIRDECHRALADEAHIQPYLDYERDQPLQQWAELNRNPRWSAYHLLKDGARHEPNASRCPATLDALSAVDQPVQQGRTPVAMYSLLKPNTHIPPHVGISNVRLVAHLPLVVPPECALRVGSSTHAWQEGEVCVFDDTIEHEAWNRSEQLRAVLIFDVWHPDLSDGERRMISAWARAADAFVGEAAAMPL